jgi:hypothetical protein
VSLDLNAGAQTSLPRLCESQLFVGVELGVAAIKALNHGGALFAFFSPTSVKKIKT